MRAMIVAVGAAVWAVALGLTFGEQANEPARLSPDMVQIEPSELQGYEVQYSGISDRKRGRIVVEQGFFHMASQDRQDGQVKGRRLLRIHGYLFDARKDAVMDWWIYPGRMSAGSPLRGTFTGDPLGTDACWSNRGYDGKFRYQLYFLKDTLTCSIDVYGTGTRIEREVSAEETYLVENIARKIIANIKRIPFEITTGPPKQWIVMPATMKFQGKPVDVKPRPAFWEGHVYVAPPVLKALGLQVEWDEWDKDLKQITVSRGEEKMVFTLGEKTAQRSDGTTQPLEGAPRMLDGFPVVPLEAVTAAFGLVVEVERPPVGRGSDGKRDGNTPVNPPPSQGFGGASPQGSPPARSSYWA